MMHNKFSIGGTVSHRQSKMHRFVIVAVMPSVPEKKGDYLYECRSVDSETKVFRN